MHPIDRGCSWEIPPAVASATSIPTAADRFIRHRLSSDIELQKGKDMCLAALRQFAGRFVVAATVILLSMAQIGSAQLLSAAHPRFEYEPDTYRWFPATVLAHRCFELQYGRTPA